MYVFMPEVIDICREAYGRVLTLLFSTILGITCIYIYLRINGDYGRNK